MKRFLALAIVVGVAIAGAAFAQTPSGSVQAIAPLTRDIGAVKIFTGQAAATITSPDQTGYNVSRVACVFNMSTHTGSPSTTFTIQNKDAASGLYYNVITSAAITADNTPTPLAAGGGVVTTTNVSAGFPVAAKWRVSIAVAGTSTPTVTGKVGCSVQ